MVVEPARLRIPHTDQEHPDAFALRSLVVLEADTGSVEPEHLDLPGAVRHHVPCPLCESGTLHFYTFEDSGHLFYRNDEVLVVQRGAALEDMGGGVIRRTKGP